MQTSLSHISPKSFVDSDPIAVYNLLEIFDGLTEFMIDYIESKTSKQGWFVKNNNKKGSIIRLLPYFYVLVYCDLISVIS